MNFFTISTLFLLVTLGAAWGFLSSLTRDSSGLAKDVFGQTVIADSQVQDSVVLDDLPPPDDTYTPDQRRYS